MRVLINNRFLFTNLKALYEVCIPITQKTIKEKGMYHDHKQV